MRDLTEVFSDAKTLLAIEPEELGAVILELAHDDGPGPAMFSMAGFMEPVNNRADSAWPQAIRSQVLRAVCEAMAWLENAGLIMPDPSQGHGTSYRCLTRRGQKLQNRQLTSAYREAAVLPPGLVHPEILEKSHAAFLRGDYDIAVLSAFKAVEIAVRKAGKYDEGELGTKLMRKAFEPGKGPLADKTLELGEQQAQSDLFAGAIGAGKNPSSHRDVEMGNAEAARLILFASHLRFIIETRPTRPA